MGTPANPRGTTNGNDRGSAESRRRRRAWLMLTWPSNVPGLSRCYRCGCLLYNPDDRGGAQVATFVAIEGHSRPYVAWPLTIDRIVPGVQGGRYVRTNIRPACGACNSSTGGALARRARQ